MIIITFINNLFIMGPAVVGIPILVKSVLKGSPSDFAYIEGCMALGALCGSLIVSKLNGKLSNGVIWGIGLIIDGITFSFFFWADSVTIAMIMIYIHGIGIPLIMVSRTSIIQLHTPNKYHGTSALSSALVGIISAYISVKVVFLFIGIGASVCGVLSLSIKQIREIQ